MSHRIALRIGMIFIATIGLGIWWSKTAISMPDRVQLHPRTPRPAPPPAVFHHSDHGTLSCMSCHPRVFAHDEARFGHAEMKAGEFCGACHERSAAPEISTYACGDCHEAQPSR